VTAVDGTGVLVVVPTYNESLNLLPLLDRIRAATPAADVLVVDDGSPDGTGRLADERSAVDPHVFVLHRSAKQGLGRAYVAGFGWGLDRDYAVFVEMDADGSHQPEQLPDLLAALEREPGAGLALGSRWVAGGRVVNWPRSREVLSRGGNAYVRLWLGLPVNDATGGYRAYRRAALEVMGLDDVDSQGYCFQVDLTQRLLAAGLGIVEVPITFVERERGDSKMSRAIVGEALWRVTAWGAAERYGQLRRRIGG
jgi:dolichol-phosphate mannosyltransferase